MDELGHILREARETKGLTLAEVQEQIRINTRFLEALEDGDYGVLPTPVHVRGFLRNYAHFLGLDPQPLLDRHELNQRRRPSRVTPDVTAQVSATTPLPSRQDQPFFDPVNVEVAVGTRRSPEAVLRLIIIIALIVALALVANRFIPLLLNNSDGSAAITEGVNDFLQGIINSNAEPAGPEAEPSIEDAFTPGAVITSTSRNNLDEVIPTPLPTRPPLPATMETIQLRLDIRERTWMEVTIDGDVVFSGIAKKGDEPYEWEAKEEAKVLTGNAIGVFVTINDIQLGPMGGRGENKEEVWQTTN